MRFFRNSIFIWQTPRNMICSRPDISSSPLTMILSTLKFPPNFSLIMELEHISLTWWLMIPGLCISVFKILDIGKAMIMLILVSFGHPTKCKHLKLIPINISHNFMYDIIFLCMPLFFIPLLIVHSLCPL